MCVCLYLLLAILVWCSLPLRPCKTTVNYGVMSIMVLHASREATRSKDRGGLHYTKRNLFQGIYHSFSGKYQYFPGNE